MKWTHKSRINRFDAADVGEEYLVRRMIQSMINDIPYSELISLFNVIVVDPSDIGKWHRQFSSMTEEQKSYFLELRSQLKEREQIEYQVIIDINGNKADRNKGIDG